ncbi:MAG TPA: efflux RND transporter periplasmic adaptor subunit [Telluria sp.]|nr:efflux RND transporter periplasmic adaptor subunit [Telluria sp.]
MKRRNLAIAAALLAAAGIGGWWFFSAQASKPGADAAEPAVSAQVATVALARAELPMSITAYGEIASRKVESLGFPQPGQLLSVPVMAGQQVHGGDLLATIASDPAAQAAYAQAASAFKLAQDDLRRNEELFKLQLATAGQRDAAAKQLDDARAALAAQAKLGGAQASAALRAPADGVVAAIPAAQGDRLPAGATVIQFGRTGTLRAVLAIEPSQSALLRAGMPVMLSTAQDGAKPAPVHLSSVERLVDPKSQMATAIAELPPALAGQFLVGMRIVATIELDKRSGWVVPRQAVLNDDNGSYLYQVAAGHARRVPVAKQAESGDQVGVDGKLDPALPVVSVGNYELEDGMAVRGAPR